MTPEDISGLPVRYEVEIERICGEPRDAHNGAGKFVMADVLVHFVDERGLGSMAKIGVFAPYDPSKTMEELKEAIAVETLRVMDHASGLLRTKFRL